MGLRAATLVILVAVLAACPPPPLRDLVPGSEWTASCVCTICIDVDPVTFECRATIETTDALVECDELEGDADEDALAARFMALCLLQDTVSSDCRLVPVDNVGNPLVMVSVPMEPSCPLVDGPPICCFRLAGTGSDAVIDFGLLQVTSSAGSASTTLTGRIAFTGGNCTTGSCPFEIQFLHLEGSDFTFAGEAVSRPIVLNTTLGTGSFHPGTSLFIIPPGGMEIFASGRIDGGERAAMRASATTPGFGILAQSSRQLLFTQTFASGDLTVDIQIVATIDNLPPTVELPPNSLVECSAEGGARLLLPATIRDADGSYQTIQWYVDGTLADVNVSVLDAFVPMGSHEVEVRVFDEDGGAATATTTVVVTDTTPPTVDLGTFCLWPPNHDLYIINDDDVRVVDTCDPTPTLEFVSATSDQPDNGAGDGNTTNDVVVNAESLCVRAERQGTDPSGRVYSVVLASSDSTGNSAQASLSVRVPHDSADGCDTAGGEPVDAADPRCIAPPPRDPVVPDNSVAPDMAPDGHHVRAGGGCSASGGASGTPLTGLAFLFWWSRRRPRA